MSYLHFFCLEEVDEKNGNVFSQGAIHLGVFVIFFRHAYLHFLILISKKENRSHVKLFTLFLKKKK